MNSRIDSVKALLSDWKVDGALFETPIDIGYFTGLDMSAGSLWITHKEVVLFVDGRYYEVAKKQRIAHVVLSSKEAFAQKLHGKICGYDARTTSCERLTQLEKWGKVWISIAGMGQQVRLCKGKEEIGKLEKSSRLLKRGFQFIRSQLKVGAVEKEIAKKFHLFCLEHGAEGLAFDPIIAFGKNSAYPHYRSENAKLKKNDHVLIDIGVKVDHYASDMTRVVFLGKPDPRLQQMYELVKAAQKAALALCKEGTQVDALDHAARQVFRAQDQEKFFVHSLGHGIGLETHEMPIIREGGRDARLTLCAGMVITIEPGLYLEGLGGVRYEDTIVIQKAGYRNFYSRL